MKRKVVYSVLMGLLLMGSLAHAATFEAVGVYDEQTVQTNAVDYSMGYSGNTTWTTGIGQTLGSSQILTVEEFKSWVEEAFAGGYGGVINFDNATMSDTSSFDTSFDGGSKLFTLTATGGSGASVTVKTAGSGGSRTAISDVTRLQGSTPMYEFDLGNFSGMDPQDVIAVGVTILGRSGSTTSNWRVIAFYTNGVNTGSSSTFRTINMSTGDTTDDSFSGIVAPEGYWITRVRVHCDASGVWSAIDDLAFVFADNLKPYEPGVSQTAQASSVDVTLSWKAAADPNEDTTGNAVNPDIVDQYVFMSPTPTDPNLYYIGATGVDPGVVDPNSEYSVLGLSYDATYYWAIVEAMDGFEQGLVVDVSTLDDVDPNNIIGPLWSFDTLASVPVIDTQPVDVIAGIGDSAALSIAVSSISPEQYVWYQSDDNANDTPADDTQAGTGSTLSFPSVAVTDEGYYYCVITNDGGSTPSDVAKLAVKRQMAHWTLDQANYSGGQYLDVSTDDAVLYPADANGVPAFDTTGIDGDAVLIDAENGWAQAGTWDPSEFTGQLTASAWVKWDGLGDGGIISKRDSWNDGLRWSLVIRPSTLGTVRFYNRNGGLSAWTNDVLPVDEWVLVVATYDGSTGKVYLNGVEKASDDGNLDGSVDAMIMLGAQDNPAVFPDLNPLEGSFLDDVQIYNYALDKFQVADLYNAASGKNVCILEYANDLDTTGPAGKPDCKVDLYDFAEYAANWLASGLYPSGL